MNRPRVFARATCPGILFSARPICLLLAATLLAACGSRQPETPAGRRVWEGPGNFVASTGVTTYDRREIAQKVPLPTCLEVGAARYRFAGVTQHEQRGGGPPGLIDTYFHLDRWRLYMRPGGALPEQPVLFVTVRGSTGIVAEYQRATDGSCAV